MVTLLISFIIAINTHNSFGMKKFFSRIFRKNHKTHTTKRRSRFSDRKGALLHQKKYVNSPVIEFSDKASGKKIAIIDEALLHKFSTFPYSTIKYYYINATLFHEYRELEDDTQNESQMDTLHMWDLFNIESYELIMGLCKPIMVDDNKNILIDRHSSSNFLVNTITGKVTKTKNESNDTSESMYWSGSMD